MNFSYFPPYFNQKKSINHAYQDKMFYIYIFFSNYETFQQDSNTKFKYAYCHRWFSAPSARGSPR